MMTNSLAQIAGEPTRQATEGGDETDPEVLAARAAAELPADFAAVRGYFAWSLLVNHEWAEGDRMRVGLVHVDFATQRRTLKSSGRWYSHPMRAHRSAGGPT